MTNDDTARYARVAFAGFVVPLRLIGAAVLIALVFPVSPRAECIRLWKTLKDAEAGSTVVFSGAVVASGGVVATFDVDRVWKGKVSQRTTLVVMPGIEVRSAAFFKPGMTYLVFATRSQNTTSPEMKEVPSGTPIYEVSVCSPTALVSDVGKDIGQLGKGKPPPPAR